MRSISTFLNFFTEGFVLKRVLKVRDALDTSKINTEFFDATFPYTEVAFYVTRIAQILLLFLSFKWPKIARAFYVSELICSMCILMLPYADWDLVVNITYHYLLI